MSKSKQTNIIRDDEQKMSSSFLCIHYYKDEGAERSLPVIFDISSQTSTLGPLWNDLYQIGWHI